MTKLATLVSVAVFVLSFAALRHAGMSLDHIGKIMELSGAAITGIGLLIAWEKAANRLPAYRRAFTSARQVVLGRITGRRGATEIAAADIGITVLTTAAAEKKDGFAPGARIDEKVYRLLDAVNEIHRDLDRAEKKITDIANAPKLTLQDADSAVAKALADFKSDLEIHAVKDLTVAICGVLISMGGIALGMV